MKNICKSKTKKLKNIYIPFNFLFAVLFSHSRFPIGAVSDILIVSQNKQNFAFCARALIPLVVRYFDEAKGEGRVTKQTMKNTRRCHTPKRLISYLLSNHRQPKRNKSHGEIIRVCIGIFTTALRNEKSNQIFNENTSLYFHSALLVI